MRNHPLLADRKQLVARILIGRLKARAQRLDIASSVIALHHLRGTADQAADSLLRSLQDIEQLLRRYSRRSYSRAQKGIRPITTRPSCSGGRNTGR